MRILDYVKDRSEVIALTERRWEANSEVAARVREILDTVQRDGDEAVTTYTRQLDCKFIDSLGLLVADREVRLAYRSVDKAFLGALRFAKTNIERFHRRQAVRSWALRQDGLVLRQRYAPLKRVGIYVPGGKAAYPSTVLMNAIPAKIAGVRELVMVTPCNGEGKIVPEVLAAAAECGISEIYRIGGAQAIGALAFGTESIRRVDKIAGPGSAYVAAAKQMVFGRVGIDMIAGPTEIVIVADGTARPAFVAADLIAQAEHDEAASPICITTSGQFARALLAEIELQTDRAPRKPIVRRALEGQGCIVRVETLSQAIELVNALAPEHVELLVTNARRLADRVTNAGSIFIGEWSTEALGDYVAGTNHTLPTLGTARFSSPLNVSDFVKFTNVIECSRPRFKRLAPYAEILAEKEGLHGHAASLRIRREAT